ncbi:sensor histidine kinase [Catellatospora tritici]|uniref:sensor histidine kinase n=1 Tax=Catellatospora tritici TaxID=2851566 RepID=UPI001C2D292B|nr:HAMP domain-containing sensor histidine kinase [Catellatospora tritici]MBV1850394.1 HAMP domain-containing histidine kinase [Catellatospora tritici]
MRRTARPPGTGRQLQTAERLFSLRLRLTGLLLALNLIGLAGMGAVALVVDERQRAEAVTADLHRTAGTAVALLYYDSGVLRLDKLFDNAVAQGSTAVFVYEADRTDLSLVFAHPAHLAVIPPDTLIGPARQVRRTAVDAVATVADERDEVVHLLAVPFRHTDTDAVAGTVIAVADPSPGQTAHRKLALALVVGGTAFTAMTCLGGWMLARRGTQPIADALTQQERFVADAAHELRTPLTVIRAVSESALADPRAQPEALRRVIGATDRLTDSVAALLTRARLVAGLRHLERQRFRLDQLAEEVLAETVQPPHTAVADTAATVASGDPTLVRIALRNLIHNAVQHGRAGDAPAAISLAVHDGVITVRDSGAGMGEDVEAGQRFRPGATGGTGLGLAIARWVAELHGGTLRLQRSPDGGTEAVLTLPPDPPR